MSHENITVIKVRDVLLVTMPPDPDDATISALQTEAMQAMERCRAAGLILDISAVETLDSFFARTVAETTHIIALMGGQTIVAGMRPSVAITAVQLGLTLGKAQTALNVDRALDRLAAAPPRR
jgi:rsbT antagonist protein RsbS